MTRRRRTRVSGRRVTVRRPFPRLGRGLLEARKGRPGRYPHLGSESSRECGRYHVHDGLRWTRGYGHRP